MKTINTVNGEKTMKGNKSGTVWGWMEPLPRVFDMLQSGGRGRLQGKH